ncbi:3-isopropylmalate dehydratase small subunit [Caproiciproducens sp. NJN-50]|uniref:LeuD/DmdB family oxidoreductase small subunit n=1 Tax=Acutalibacteraceae TaxID=3082771 RepID=UPI000FFE0E90|nr:MULTISPECIES: 3-isopropylmalate dehydratase small subunit [Acutalibacteraceae]QAT50555.1 3-isopropylmalate dehydratase small subunit [Caproiciproducens sp. NJN-50]
MQTTITGRAAVVLGNNIDTDQIYPGRFLDLIDPKAIGSHCLCGVDPEIAGRFHRGDIIVAGTNFGCGSSREHAPIALLSMGASLVLADSFARIFFRNSINLGLPLLICKGISQKVRPGQALKVDLLEGTAEIAETGEVLSCERIGGHALAILEAGGIKPMFRAKMGLK